MSLNIKGSEAIKEYTRKCKMLEGRRELTVELNKSLLEQNDYPSIIKDLPEESIKALRQYVQQETLDKFLELYADTLVGRKDIIITKEMRKIFPHFTSRSYDTLNKVLRREYSKNLPKGFVDIPGFSKYTINENGFLITKKDRLPKKVLVNEKGYVVTTMAGDDKNYLKKLHLLVYLAFKGETDLTIDHLDGNKTDYSIGNLEAVTIGENKVRAKQNGLLSNVRREYTRDLTDEEVLFIYNNKDFTAKELAKRFNVSDVSIYSIKAGKSYSKIIERGYPLDKPREKYVNGMRIKIHDDVLKKTYVTNNFSEFNNIVGLAISKSNKLLLPLKYGPFRDRFIWKLEGDTTSFRDILRNNVEVLYDVYVGDKFVKTYYSYRSMFDALHPMYKSNGLKYPKREEGVNMVRKANKLLRIEEIKRR